MGTGHHHADTFVIMSSSESESEEQVQEEGDEEKGIEEELVEDEDHKGVETTKKTFEELGLNEVLLETVDKVGWKKPSRIQEEAIPIALEGKDVIGLAETGSGKTGAFALPILHSFQDNPQRFFALVLTPTRELAFQIAEQFDVLGEKFGLKCAAL